MQNRWLFFSALTIICACACSAATDDESGASSGGAAPGSGGAASGGVGGDDYSSGGESPGGGGSPGAGGASGGGGGTPSDEPPEIPCGEGDTDAEVFLEGETWVARRGDEGVYAGASMLDAVRAAINSLTPNRASKERVVLRDSGTMTPGQTLDIPSQTIFESCGSITVSGSDPAVRVRSDVDVPYLSLAGTAGLGIFIRQSSNIHLGKIELRFEDTGRGIRIDNNNNASNNWGRLNRITNIRLDDVYVEGTSGHGVETYGVDGLVIGKVVARRTGDAGLLLNATVNAEIGLVDGEQTAYIGTGYAAFRMANENGRLSNFGDFDSPDVDTDYAPNIHVGEVRARGGGRGIFCVSGSGGAVIDHIDIVDVGNSPAVFIEDCYNVSIGGGTLDGGSAKRGMNITARSPGSEHATFLHYSTGITVENVTLIDSFINESSCGAGGENLVRNNTLVRSDLNLCSGTDGGGNVTQQ